MTCPVSIRISGIRKAYRVSSTNGRHFMPRLPKCTMRMLSNRWPSPTGYLLAEIEVGHIFYFGTKYSEPMNASVTGPDGKEHTVHMGSYGIGPTRLVPAIIEASHDDNGIIWPASVAPFDLSLINMKVGDAACDAACEKLYAELTAAGMDVLYDDRDERAGVKFATADLIGLPYQVVVGPRSIASGEVEIKDRRSGDRQTIPLEAAINKLTEGS